MLLAFVFLLDAFITFLHHKHGEKDENKDEIKDAGNNIYTRAILCIGVFLMILWLSS